MEAEKAQEGGDLRAVDSLILRVDITKEGHRRVVMGHVDTLHGGEFDRLGANHSASRGICADRLEYCSECRETRCYGHRGTGKVCEAPLQQVPGTDTQDQEGAHKP